LLFDSQTDPTLFDLTNQNYIEIKPALASPAIGFGQYTCQLVVYDAGELALGYFWPTNFVLKVKPESN